MATVRRLMVTIILCAVGGTVARAQGAQRHPTYAVHNVDCVISDKDGYRLARAEGPHEAWGVTFHVEITSSGATSSNADPILTQHYSLLAGGRSHITEVSVGGQRLAIGDQHAFSYDVVGTGAGSFDMVVRLLSDERGWNSLILVGGVHPRQGDDAFDYDGLLVGVSDSAPQSSANVETGDSRELLGLPFDPGYPFAPTYGLEALGHYLGLDRQGLMVGDVVSQEVNSLPQWQQTGIEYTIEAAKIVDDVTTGGAWTAAITSAQANSHDADVKCAEAVAMTILLVWDGPAALVGRVVKVGGTVIVKMAEVYSRVPKTIVKQIAEGLARALSLGVRQGKEFLQGWVQRCILAREAQRAAAKDALDAAGKIALEEAEYAAEKKAAEAAAANCFAAGTVIQMANGTTKPIEHVRVGDLVWSRNEGIGRTEACKVGRTSVRHVKSALYLAFANAATGATDHVVTTSEHPFYVKAKGFVRAGSLGNGTQIVTRAGPPASVSATETRNDRDGYTVYNLTVESDHTFFVGKLAGGVWVHNCTVDPNKLIHIFDNAGHHLSPVVQFFGSQKVAFVAIQTAFSKVAGRYTAEQLLVGIPVKVGPFMITIRGVFVEGVPRVSTAFIPPIP